MSRLFTSIGFWLFVLLSIVILFGLHWARVDLSFVSLLVVGTVRQIIINDKYPDSWSALSEVPDENGRPFSVTNVDLKYLAIGDIASIGRQAIIKMTDRQVMAIFRLRYDKIRHLLRQYADQNGTGKRLGIVATTHKPALIHNYHSKLRTWLEFVDRLPDGTVRIQEKMTVYDKYGQRTNRDEVIRTYVLEP